MVDAVESLGVDWGFTVLRPCRIIFRLKGDQGIEYHPDAVWTWGTKTLKLVVWEVENSPSTKTVVGDVALATLLAKGRAEIYTKDHPLGTVLRKPVRFVDIYKRSAKSAHHTVAAGYRRLPSPNQVHFRMVVRGGWRKSYFGRYLNLFGNEKPRPFRDYVIVTCDTPSLTLTKRSLSKMKAVSSLKEYS